MSWHSKHPATDRAAVCLHVSCTSYPATVLTQSPRPSPAFDWLNNHTILHSRANTFCWDGSISWMPLWGVVQGAGFVNKEDSHLSVASVTSAAPSYPPWIFCSTMIALTGKRSPVRAAVGMLWGSRCCPPAGEGSVGSPISHTTLGRWVGGGEGSETG